MLHAQGLADRQVLGRCCGIGPLERRQHGRPPPSDCKSPVDAQSPQAWHPGGSSKACCRSGHRSETWEQARSCTGRAFCRLLASHVPSCASQPFLISYPSAIKTLRTCAQLLQLYLFVTLWTVAHQAALSTGFSRQEYWSGCCFLLQRIFLTKGSNPHFLHWQADSLPLSHLGSPSLNVQTLLIGPTAAQISWIPVTVNNNDILKIITTNLGTMCPTRW